MSGLIVLFLLIIVLVAVSRRNKARLAAAKTAKIQQIEVGTEVMTTSGLYATVVSMEPDGPALLSIAPGVEVRWAIAALKPVKDLAPQERRPGPSLFKRPAAKPESPRSLAPGEIATEAQSDDEPTDTK